jgi:hypothetical protein
MLYLRTVQLRDYFYPKREIKEMNLQSCVPRKFTISEAAFCGSDQIEGSRVRITLNLAHMRRSACICARLPMYLYIYMGRSHLNRVLENVLSFQYFTSHSEAEKPLQKV